MAYETLTVRMSRSNPSIPWGLTFRASGSDIVIDTVEKESLADKAAIEPNDKITEFAECKGSELTLSQANAILKRPSSELKFILSRYITSHPSLPWNLTDQENKIVVDQINPPKLTQLQNSYTSKSFNETIKSSQEIGTSLPRPVALGYEPAPFKSPTSTSTYEEQIVKQQKSFQNQYTSSNYTKNETFGADNYKTVPITTTFSSKKQPNTDSNFGSESEIIHPVEQTTNPKPYVPTNITRSVPVQSNVSKVYTASFPSTNRQAILNQRQHQQGSKTAFRHSPRTIRQLSPTASVKYLHTNPSNVSYAYETPAEEYLRKTGGLFGTDPNLSRMSKTPYLTSETRRLIAEEETGLGRATSPAQSGSFKRISRAVGTPVS